MNERIESDMERRMNQCKNEQRITIQGNKSQKKKRLRRHEA